jgi:tRNA-Thr(GGU) m(6)t(6)A37 methyltransferase TsaA
MKKIQLTPIGVIHSPFKSPDQAPASARRGKGIAGTIEIYPEYKEGLADLDGFSHIVLVFYMHLSKGYSLKVVPNLDSRLRGLFATRAPRRPNPIGVSVVRLEKIEGTTLYVSDMDMVDGTPLLDIKPYVPDSEKRENVKIGWLSGKLKSG